MKFKIMKVLILLLISCIQISCNSSASESQQEKSNARIEDVVHRSSSKLAERKSLLIKKLIDFVLAP